MKKATSSPQKSGRKLKAEFNEKAEKPISAGRIEQPDARRTNLKGKRFVITSAQNNTDVHEGFVKALESYCKENDAQLIVTPFTYNKKAYEQHEDGSLWYDPKIRKYLLNESANIAKDLVLCAELDISPTAAAPLSGLDNYCQGKSGIAGHTKFAMKSLPGLGEDSARFMYTTGTCTKRNYIQNKAGQKAEFHHNYGALVVEVDNDGTFFVRQLAADNSGAFYDLTEEYKPDGKILRNQRVEAVQLGDIHVEKLDTAVNELTFGKGGLMETLRPKRQYIHDLLDFTTRNHHNMKDPLHWAKQYRDGKTVEGDIDLAAAWLKANEREDRQDLIVDSNHDQAYTRWLREASAEFDPPNRRFWLESKLHQAKEIEAGKPEPNMLEWAIRRKRELKYAHFMKEGDSSLLPGNIEGGIHGHTGPNGVKGSPNSFRRLGTKVNTGHTHSAGIIDGVYTSGVHGKLNMDYNKGPSSWSHSNIVTYPNGKRAIITIKEGKWRADCKKVAVPAAKKDKTHKVG